MVETADILRPTLKKPTLPSDNPQNTSLRNKVMITQTTLGDKTPTLNDLPPLTTTPSRRSNLSLSFRRRITNHDMLLNSHLHHKTTPPDFLVQITGIRAIALITVGISPGQQFKLVGVSHPTLLHGILLALVVLPPRDLFLRRERPRGDQMIGIMIYISHIKGSTSSPATKVAKHRRA
jgi:hypothetical protein